MSIEEYFWEKMLFIICFSYHIPNMELIILKVYRDTTYCYGTQIS